jgi:hypothetical protein
MAGMTSTLVQIAAAASTTTDAQAILRYVDAIQMALEMAEQEKTADAFLSLSELIQDGEDLFAAIPAIAATGMEAEKDEPDSLSQLVRKSKKACRNLRSTDLDVLFEVTVMACGLSSWAAVAKKPNAATLVRVEDALLEMGRAIAGAAITRLSGKVVPAGA